MSITIFVPRDNGDLKYLAEVDEVERPEMALDALLDELPRLVNQGPNYVALVGTTEDAISVSRNGVVPAVVEPDEDDEEPAKPRRRAARKQTRTGTAKRAARKPAAAKVDGRSRAGRAAKAKAGGKSPFRSRPDDD